MYYTIACAVKQILTARFFFAISPDTVKYLCEKMAQHGAGG
jgi:hypothetical protein